jgi:hypothetical protein
MVIIHYPPNGIGDTIGHAMLHSPGGRKPIHSMSDFRASPMAGIDPGAASGASASVYELIREDIVEGRLRPNERLIVSELARRHGTSTNPVRARSTRISSATSRRSACSSSRC